jgi:ribosome assembly protein YihI (activator of Der GTPase)
MEKRIDHLDAAWRRRAPQSAHQTDEYDLGALDMYEQYELDQLLARLAGRAPLSDGEQDLSVFSDAELDRLTELAQKMMTTEVA